MNYTEEEFKYFMEDFERHRDCVNDNIYKCSNELMGRAEVHDFSKLAESELSGYAWATKKLNDYPYGSPERKEIFDKFKDCVDIHYKNNDHHPEHFENGVNDMNLIQILEMICDWKGAAECRGGNIDDTITSNKDRFKIDDQLWSIIMNTIKFLKEEKE